MSPRALVRTAVPGPRSQALFEAEQADIAPGLQSIALLSKIAVARGEGAVVEDLDGNRFIDFSAGVAVASLGHAHPRFVEAVSAQAARIAVGSFTSECRAELTRLLAEIAPGDLRRTQYYSSGAEAVEAAVRLARSATGTHEVLGFWRGFHGKTGGVLGLLGDDFKHGLGPLHPGRFSSPYAHCYRCPFEARHPDCDFLCARFLRRQAPARDHERRRRDHRRARPGHGGQRRAATGVPRAPEGVRGGDRGAADRGRDDHRLRPDRPDVRLRARRGRSRHHDDRQGLRVGVPALGHRRPGRRSRSPGRSPTRAAAPRATAATRSRPPPRSRPCARSSTATSPATRSASGAFMLARLRAIAERVPIVGDVRGRGLLIGVELVKDGPPGSRSTGASRACCSSAACSAA